MTSAAHEKDGFFTPITDSSLHISLKIRKSKRRTWSLTLNPDRTLLMKIPFSVSYTNAEKLLYTKEAWILKKYAEAKAAQAKKAPDSGLTDAQRKALESRYRQAAREYFAARVAYYEPIIGVTHTSIHIRDQKTRWGSCSAKGGLNFNWRLMLAPPRVLDYVVVHELCHRKEMNHSKVFWHTVEMVLPDYKELRKWLRDYGGTLIL